MAASSSFVSSARALEALKTNPKLHENSFQSGKYMILVDTQFICVENNGVLAWRNYEEIKSLTKDELPQKLLLDISTVQGKQVFLFALDFDNVGDDTVKKLESNVNGKFIGARESLLRLKDTESLYVAKAKGLSSFNKTFKFCPNCGSSLVSSQIGILKECNKCSRTHYPPLCPVAIVLIDNPSHDEVLLVRQERHPAGMYSCVAGFIEPGETLDKAVEREVAEEVGLRIKDIQFVKSQPWAMPNSQLMLACVGTAESSDFVTDEKEILEAKWIKAEDLKSAVDRTKAMTGIPKTSGTDQEFWVPPSFTASYQLMVEWLARFHKLR
ncbi:UNVERIFIED_CONTAM: hypothetical protein PYX00_003910 [Menopon gallinae]|uniref:NAD(+) diphosphatase n=1 Tax=Menopon gallinae TaxID=328185 RepID=A0AAW2I2P8_9NEOP